MSDAHRWRNCECLVDVERRLVVSRGTGTFGHADFLEHLERLRADPRFEPGFDHLVDGRQFDRFDLTAEQLRDMGSRSVFAPTSRRALVVSSVFQFGLARMFAAFREAESGQDTMVFRDMREATAWLGLPADYEPGARAESTDCASHD
jgi:hypothetical protein